MVHQSKSEGLVWIHQSLIEDHSFNRAAFCGSLQTLSAGSSSEECIREAAR